MTQKMGKSFEQDALPHLDAIWWTALWLTNSQNDAEKLVEDVFIEACRNWDESISLSECRVWMFKMLINTFMMANKMNFQLALPPNFDEEYEPFPPDGIPLINSIPKEIISGAIRCLPIENRLLITLSVFEKFSYQEIANILAISRKTVSLRIYQAYTIIHKELFKYIASGSMTMPVANCS